MNLLLTVVTLFVTVILTARMCSLALLFQNELPHNLQKVMSMSIGTMSGITAGSVINGLMHANSFIALLSSMTIGMGAGVVVGLPMMFEAAIEGLVAGIMGGMMGSMLMSDAPLFTSGCFLVLFVAVVFLLHQLIHIRVNGHPATPPSSKQILRGIVIVSAATVIVAIILLGAPHLTR
ncbi:hypothetical protein [Alicyclobacillus acidoterrestris]|uniref:Uncharacterized protein n=1 Tax=Alicyclobacillus acidoterrestris (strain ATCC 49025 / DSM 3922 / CIP 106132 / NCIMB 13137 / GD3B) TaxID=1356854 RepID=T0D0Y2_ALIAG|nr:hypothetical protein [Alicyclobacillus acidoterrestris]EPZ45202.1 hypothetical protein N007_09370 [Alicyclobacillus acidoterrestris ATCC 49025]UNO49907.1 hypothetical protein K1I37_05230 [Alicyclobacillus acidoterrestris]